MATTTYPTLSLCYLQKKKTLSLCIETKSPKVPRHNLSLLSGTQNAVVFSPLKFDQNKVACFSVINCGYDHNARLSIAPKAVERKVIKKVGKNEHHLWNKRDSAGSGQKALNLVRIVSGLPNEKEAVYGALDKWSAWETEFPLIAAAKALKILRNRSQWLQVIQVAKWMLSKGQGATMTTYDTLLLAFDMDQRVDEAESLWNMILHTHTRSISKQLFSRMTSLYDHHHMPDQIIEVFADMEELGIKPDEDTVRRVAGAFRKQGQEDKQRLVLQKYLGKWKYIHHNGERVRVRRDLKHLNVSLSSSV